MKQLLVVIGKNKNILNNISYLSILEILSLLVPIIIYPFLVRILGGDIYGKVIYAQSIIGVIVIITSWGLNAIGIKEISANRDNENYINYIFSHIFYIKILFVIIAIALYFIINAINNITIDIMLYILSLWVIFYDILFPIWYFQGLENMKTMAYIILIGRFIFLLSIFLLIRNPDDYLLYPFSNLLSVLFCVLVGNYIIFIKHNRKLVRINLQQMKKIICLGFPVFLSNVSSVFITNSNKILLGNFVGMSAVTVYDFLEKIISLLRIPSTIIRQSIFPKMSLNKNANISYILMFVTIMNIILIVATFITKDILVNVFLGKEFLFVSSLLSIYVCVTLISTISGYLIYLKLIPYEIKYGMVIILSLLLYITIITINYLYSSITYEFIIATTIVIELLIALLIVILYLRKVYYKNE